MILQEILTGKLEKYDYSLGEYGEWVTLVELNNANIVRADAQRQCTNDDCFGIGGVFAATMNIVLRLPQGIGLFQLRGCRLYLHSSLAGDIGVFFVTNAVRRTGRIFQLACHDSVVWTDTSSQTYEENVHFVLQHVLDYFSENYSNTTQGWMNQRHLTEYVNRFIYCTTGYKNLVSWENYDLNQNQGVDVCNHEMQFSVYRGSGTSETYCPRDVYKLLAELSFGFVYAKPDNGALTLGQFAEPKWGVAELYDSEIEYDSGDFADYNIYMKSVTCMGTDVTGVKGSRSWYITPDHATAAFFDIVVQDNPFLDKSYQLEIQKGHDAGAFLNNVARNMFLAFHRPAEIVQKGFGYLVSPFKCTVHGKHTFHLGQKVLIHHKDYDGTVRVHDSIITKICWSFQGGQTIQCCGGDSRNLTEILRVSKGDKVRSALQEHCSAIERRTMKMTVAEYEALEEPDDNTLYCLV